MKIVPEKGSDTRLERFLSVLESYFPSHGEPPGSEKAPPAYMPQVPLLSNGSLQNPTPAPFPTYQQSFRIERLG